MVLSVHYLAYCVCKLMQQLAAVLRNKPSTWLCRHWQDLMLCGNAAGNVHVKLVPFATLRFQLTFMTVACRRHHWRWGVQRNFQKLSRRTEIGGRWASFFGVCHFVKNLCSFRLWNFARNGVASVVCGSDGNKTKVLRPKSRTPDQGQGQGQDWLNKTRTRDAHHVDRKFGTALSAFANRYMSYMVNSRKTFIARHYSDLRNAHYWKRERRVFCHPKIKKNQTVLKGKKV